MAVAKERRVWRYEDLFDLPNDGRRYEIIDGELHEMPSPNMDHADASANLMFLLAPIVRGRGGRIYTAPVDVFLPGADPVQPDLLVLMPERRRFRTLRGVEGPPDLVIEIVSPSNPEHDRDTKRRVYARGGVTEYWLVDPATLTIEVLVLTGDVYQVRLRASGDELVTSEVLPELAFPASVVFA